MPESDQLSVDIRTIKERVKAIESLMDILVVSSRDNVLPVFLRFFGNSENKVKVYLAVNDERSVADIVTITGITRTNVSSHLVQLHKAGLLTRHRIGQEKIYAKKNWDYLIGLSSSLRSKFGIDAI